MQPDPISLIAGLCIVAVGVALLWSQSAAWRSQQHEFRDDPRELRHLEARWRRRLQTSGLIVIVGILIPVADVQVIWRALGPQAAALMWIAIVSLCIWIVVLAVGDMVTTRAHSRATLARLQAHKQQLMDELERLRPKTKADEK